MGVKRLVSHSRLLLLLSMLLMSFSSHAKVMTFTLDNVLTTAGESMTGSFDWTYIEGDFENGSGLFTELNIPRYGTDLSSLIITIDLSSIEFSLAGNFHNQGVDINFSLLSPLSINSPSLIDTSFNGVNYVSKFNVHGFGTLGYQGGFLAGKVSPVSMIPEPKPIWLLITGLMAVGCRTWKQYPRSN